MNLQSTEFTKERYTFELSKEFEKKKRIQTCTQKRSKAIMERKSYGESNGDQGRMPDLEMKQNLNSLALSSSCISAQIADDGSDDNDFFESLRQRQSTNYKNSDEQNLKENMVDSTPSMIVLDTPRHNDHSDIPDLISNISPTSLSTTSSGEKYDNDGTPTYDKSRGKEISSYEKPETTSELTTSSTHFTSRTKSRFLFRFAPVVVLLLSSASWLSHNGKMLKTHNLKAIVNGLNRFHGYVEDQMSLDIFRQYQDAHWRPHFHNQSEKIGKQEIQNHARFSEGKYIQLQENEQCGHDASYYQKPQELIRNNSITDDWQQLEIGKASSPHSSEDDETSPAYFSMGNTFGGFNARSNNILNLFRQITNKLVTATDDIAEYFNSAAKSTKFRIDYEVNYIANYVNNVLDDLATKNAEIHANSHFMVGGRESLIRIWKAAKIMILKINQRVSDIAQHVNKILDDLATENAEIQASKYSMVGSWESVMRFGKGAKSMMSKINNQVNDIAQYLSRVMEDLSSANSRIQNSDVIHMEGARKTLANIGSIIGKQTSKMISRKLRITSMMVYV